MAGVIYRFRPFTTPKSHTFVDPDTKHEYRAQSAEALMRQIESYRSQNQLKLIDNLPLVLESYWCSLPENQGACRPTTLPRGLFQYFKGSIALLANVFYGEKAMVSDETAEGRAQICITCPHNVFPDKEGFMAWSDDIAEASTGGRRAKSHEQLGNCEICTCPLRAKVFKREPFGISKEENQKLPPWCWQKDH